MEPHPLNQTIKRWVQLLQSTYARVAFGMILIGAGYLLLFSYFGSSSSDRLYELRREEIKRITYLGVNILQPVLDRLSRGEISERQALDEARDLIRRMKYMYGVGPNYVFMGDDN